MDTLLGGLECKSGHVEASFRFKDKVSLPCAKHQSTWGEIWTVCDEGRRWDGLTSNSGPSFMPGHVER